MQKTKKKHQSMSALAPRRPWKHTKNPMVRLHIDYLGPFTGKMFLVIVGSYSKLVKVFPVSKSTSQTTIICLRTCFTIYLFILDKQFNNITICLKKGRLAIHNISIVRLIKVKSKVNIYVAITL